MPGECKVCYDTKILEDTTDAGCTHEPDVCLECLRKVTTCPICRQTLEQFLAARVLPAQTNRVSIRAPLPQQRRTGGPNRDAANSGNRNVHRTTTEQENLLAQEENLLAHDLLMIQQMEQIQAHARDGQNVDGDDALLADDLRRIEYMEHMQDMQQIMEMQHMENIKHYSSF